MAEQVALHGAEDPYGPVVERVREQDLAVPAQIGLEIQEHRHRILLLSELQQDLETETCGRGEVYEIWWALE